MKVYHGSRLPHGVSVTVDGYPLKMRQDVRNHSPDGAEWGYGGSGPAQLALAILLDCTGDRDLSEKLYQDFKWDVIARIAANSWSLTSQDVMRWVEKTGVNLRN